MPTKNFSGSLISYGTVLPNTSTTPDGALFFKVGGADEGLYLFSFIADTDSINIGDQSSQGWTAITGLSSAIDADTLDGYDSSAFQLSNPLLSAITSLGTNGILVKTGANTVATRAITGDSTITITPVAGDGVAGNIGISVNQTNLSLNSIGGTLSLSKGGTGTNLSITQGGVIYGASTSTLASTAAGAAGRLLSANGALAPSWVDPASLTVGTANYANSAGTAGSATTAGALSPGATIDIAGPVGNLGYLDATATTFTGASNITINVNGINANLLTAGTIPTDMVLWDRIANMTTAVRTFSAFPIATTTTYARPSLFYNLGGGSVTIQPDMSPPDFESSSLSGFDAYNVTGMPSQYIVGLTVMGSSGDGGKALQIAGNWNFSEAAPAGALSYRVNDDNVDPSAWGAWRTIVDTGSSIFNNYVLKGGDVMTGTLQTTALAVGSATMPSTGSANFSGNILATNITASYITRGAVFVQAGTSGTGTGYMNMRTSYDSGAGIIEFMYGNDLRAGYIGTAPQLGINDEGTITYRAGVHSFVGDILASGKITSQNNIVGINLITSGNGIVRAGDTTANGWIQLKPSGTSNSGYVEFFGASSVRSGYIGNTQSVGTIDTGTITYAAATHFFAGNIECDSNITAFAPSDARLKKDIVTIEDALDKVKALRGVDYTMKDTDRRETGLIAQEVLQVVPEVVREGADGVYGVAYGNLVGLLVEALKEQDARITQLQLQLEELKRTS